VSREICRISIIFLSDVLIRSQRGRERERGGGRGGRGLSLQGSVEMIARATRVGRIPSVELINDRSPFRFHFTNRRTTRRLFPLPVPPHNCHNFLHFLAVLYRRSYILLSLYRFLIRSRRSLLTDADGDDFPASRSRGAH